MASKDGDTSTEERSSPTSSSADGQPARQAQRFPQPDPQPQRTRHKRRSSSWGRHHILDESTPRQDTTIPDRGRSHSPVKSTEPELESGTPDLLVSECSRTYIKRPPPFDILEYPTIKHSRLKVSLQIHSPLAVGGSSLEGHLRLAVEDSDCLKYREPIDFVQASVDLVGFEEVSGHRRAIFLALCTELIDTNNLLQRNKLANSVRKECGSTLPAPVTLQFKLNLPLDTGPPPFQSKHANICFQVSATVMIDNHGRTFQARTSQNIEVFPAYDPEKVLASLDRPLLASDHAFVGNSTRFEQLKLTAGMHRMVWLSGGSVFIDVHISNESRKTVKKLDISLERNILFYKHAPATTLEPAYDQPRVFDRNERSVLAKLQCKTRSKGWQGVEPYGSDTRTFELEVPRGHTTVRCGTYLEVRYFINVTVPLSMTKSVKAQLPIILIHINSLDVVPNSVAQVAAAMEQQKAHETGVAAGSCSRSRSQQQDSLANSRVRSRSSPAVVTHEQDQTSSSFGRAFGAPRDRSLDLQRERQADIIGLQEILDASPRKCRPPKQWKGFALRSFASLHNLRRSQSRHGPNTHRVDDVATSNAQPPLMPVPPPFISTRSKLSHTDHASRPIEGTGPSQSQLKPEENPVALSKSFASGERSCLTARTGSLYAELPEPDRIEASLMPRASEYRRDTSLENVRPDTSDVLLPESPTLAGRAGLRRTEAIETQLKSSCVARSERDGRRKAREVHWRDIGRQHDPPKQKEQHKNKWAKEGRSSSDQEQIGWI